MQQTFVVLIGKPTDPEQVGWLPTVLYQGTDRAAAVEIHRRLLASGYPAEQAVFGVAEVVRDSADPSLDAPLADAG